MWLSDGSSALKIENDVIGCDATETGDSNYNGLWLENGGDGVNSGEHYWTLKFTNLSNSYTAIGLSNKDRFGPGYKLKGLMYGGNLHNGGNLLVQSFGPGISSNDTIGLLASFNDPGRLKMYLFQNDTPLGLAFDVASSVLPNACPTIRFSGGSGSSAQIKKEDTIPTDRVRVAKQYEGIEGPWKIQPTLVKIEGTAIAEDDRRFSILPRITMKLTKASDDGLGENSCNVSLKVLNNISFQIERTPNGAWKNGGGSGGARSTMMGGPPELLQFETKVSELCQDPESVQISGDGQQMTIARGDLVVTFGRYDDAPKYFDGEPFN